ncbi:hypothetical protein [Saccharomonospora saliphila]|uniref:hypothetical protein n=1 Tax=Saccharomonospora saliphila TaxID=369829 RepID=UPI0012FA342C|nr:hypothetical protein [Saccharomonospora saliphila]
MEPPESAGHSTEQDQHGVDDRDAQIAQVTALVGTVVQRLRNLETTVDRLSRTSSTTTSENERHEVDEPAPWVWFAPPKTADDEPTEDPRVTVENFVAWYNETFVGNEGGRAKRIPPCWHRHPGLAMEIAALTYSWRAANMGAAASVRDAQHWLHQWRPGFADRLARDWLHADCLDGDHRTMASAAPRKSRFNQNE